MDMSNQDLTYYVPTQGTRGSQFFRKGPAFLDKIVAEKWADENETYNPADPFGWGIEEYFISHKSIAYLKRVIERPEVLKGKYFFAKNEILGELVYVVHPETEEECLVSQRYKGDMLVLSDLGMQVSKVLLESRNG